MHKPLTKKTPLVWVRWTDASRVSAFWDQKTTTALVDSIGFLVRRNKKEVILAMAIAIDGEFGGLFAIPSGCVKFVKHIKKPS